MLNQQTRMAMRLMEVSYMGKATVPMLPPGFSNRLFELNKRIVNTLYDFEGKNILEWVHDPKTPKVDADLVFLARMEDEDAYLTYLFTVVKEEFEKALK